MLSNAFVKDPNEADCVLSIFNGWIEGAQNYPEGAFQKMGILISYSSWAQYQNQYNTFEPSIQILLVASLGVFARFISNDGITWTEWTVVAQ